VVFYQPNKIIAFLILFCLKIKQLTVFWKQKMNIINQQKNNDKKYKLHP